MRRAGYMLAIAPVDEECSDQMDRLLALVTGGHQIDDLVHVLQHLLMGDEGRLVVRPTFRAFEDGFEMAPAPVRRGSSWCRLRTGRYWPLPHN